VNAIRSNGFSRLLSFLAEAASTANFSGIHSSAQKGRTTGKASLWGSSVKVIVAVAVVALLCTSWGSAQTVTGSITGTVTDTDGLAVSGARVVATNVGTSVETNTTTNKQGVYTIRFLPIGTYRVSIGAKGFATQSITGITLELGKVAKVNASLKVGSAATTVRVSAGTQLLNTHDATLGITFNSREIERVPLNGENFSTVTLFEPGAIDTQRSGMTSPGRNLSQSGVVSENGNRGQDNNYLLDGIPMNQIYNNLIGYNPAPAAIQEVKVVSANGSAQNGNASGGETLVQLKSGTSQFHGEVYEHYENQNMQANTWSNKHANPVIPRSKFSQSIYGGTLGGPILPKRLFFFADYEGYGNHAGGIGTISVMTAAMRQGDFSALLHPTTGATPIQLYDTQNNFAPYPNNQVPIVNPVAKFIFAHPSVYPLPNATPTTGYLNGNYQGPNKVSTSQHQYDIKLDWTPDRKDSISGFFSYSKYSYLNITPNPLAFDPLVTYPSRVFGTSWVHVFSAALVNNAHFGFTVVNWNFQKPVDRTGVFGLTGDSKVGIPLPFAQMFEGFTQQRFGAANLGNIANPVGTDDTQFYYADDLTWQRGKHLLSMGVQIQNLQENYPATGGDGYLGFMSYSGAFTSNPNVSSGGTGFGAADFVLDRVQSAAIAQFHPNFQTREWLPAVYFEDDWTVTPKLTVTAGLRYSYYQPWHETGNRVDNIIQSGPNKGLVEYAGSVPAGAPAGSLTCSNRGCYNPVFDQLQPRLGFAYQIMPQLVIRGGYGATTDLEGNQANVGGPPFRKFYTENTLSPTKTSGGTPFTAEQGFTAQTSKTTYTGFGAIDPNLRPAYVQQWSLTLGYAINQNTSLNIGYVGEAARHLLNYRNLNQLTAPGAPAPYASLVGQTGGLFDTTSNAVANYNALQTTLRQRLSHGLSYTFNYTYGRTLSDSNGFYGTPAIAGQGGPQDGYHPGLSYGNSDLDIRNNFSAVVSYELPFGHGREFAAHVNRIANELIGGWNLSGTGTVYSGYPVTIIAPSESQVFSYGRARANQYRPLIIRNRSLEHWFGTDPSATPCVQPGLDNGVCAYGTPAIGTFGTAGVNTQRAPGYHQFDASLFKDFPTFRGQALTFRLDDFNVGNISSYSTPSFNVAAGNFGQVNGTVSPPQELQISLKYKF
jgi:hypothetical protein